MLVDRPDLYARLQRALGRARAVVLAGPRQSGKSTLAAMRVPRRGARWFDLEHPVDRDRLQHPLTALESLAAGGGHGTVVIDEVHLVPGLFPVLRVLIDRSDARPASTCCSAAHRRPCCDRPASRCSAASRSSRLAASTWTRPAPCISASCGNAAATRFRSLPETMPTAWPGGRRRCSVMSNRAGPNRRRLLHAQFGEAVDQARPRRRKAREVA